MEQASVIPLGLGLPGELCPLKDIHPVFDEVNVLLHVLGPPDAEGHVPVKAAEPALVPAAAPVDPQQQTVRLTGGRMGPSSNPLYGVIFCKAGSSFLIFEVIIQELPRPCKASLPGAAGPGRNLGKTPVFAKKELAIPGTSLYNSCGIFSEEMDPILELYWRT